MNVKELVTRFELLSITGLANYEDIISDLNELLNDLAKLELITKNDFIVKNIDVDEYSYIKWQLNHLENDIHYFKETEYNGESK